VCVLVFASLLLRRLLHFSGVHDPPVSGNWCWLIKPSMHARLEVCMRSGWRGQQKNAHTHAVSNIMHLLSPPAITHAGERAAAV
jgi:hypothetical protein